jgi:hypothetical protein
MISYILEYSRETKLHRYLSRSFGHVVEEVAGNKMASGVSTGSTGSVWVLTDPFITDVDFINQHR